MVASIIRAFQEPFDAHELERLTLRRHTEAFARELLEHRKNRDPLRGFSSQFGKWVDFAFRQQIQKTKKVRSENLAGLVCSNQQWRLKP
jgi:hypothetical protein